jgi:hypothetical protein
MKNTFMAIQSFLLVALRASASARVASADDSNNHVAVSAEQVDRDVVRTDGIGTLDEQLERLAQGISKAAALARAIRQERRFDSLVVERVLKGEQVHARAVDRIPGELLDMLGD